MGRTVLPPAQLYAILDREFRKARSVDCTQCSVPLPYWQHPPDEVSANWLIGTPRQCPHGCASVIAEVMANLWTRYDIGRATPMQ